MAVIEIKVKTDPFPILTITQFSEVTGKPVSEINRRLMTLERLSDETYLDKAYPFPSKNNAMKNGLKFVVINKKALDYVRECIVKPRKEITIICPDEDGNPGTIQSVQKGSDLSDLGLWYLMCQKLR